MPAALSLQSQPEQLNVRLPMPMYIGNTGAVQGSRVRHERKPHPGCRRPAAPACGAPPPPGCAPAGRGLEASQLMVAVPGSSDEQIPFFSHIQPSKRPYAPVGSPPLTTPVPVCSVPAVLWAVPDGSTLAAPGSADCTKQGMTNVCIQLGSYSRHGCVPINLPSWLVTRPNAAPLLLQAVGAALPEMHQIAHCCRPACLPEQRLLGVLQLGLDLIHACRGWWWLGCLALRGDDDISGSDQQRRQRQRRRRVERRHTSRTRCNALLESRHIGASKHGEIFRR